MTPHPAPPTLRPPWARGLALAGAMLAFAFMASAVLHEIEWRTSVAGDVRDISGLAALLVMFVLMLQEGFAVRRHEAWAATWRAAEEHKLQELARLHGFIDELKHDAAYAAVCENPFHAADLLGMLLRHALISEQEFSALLERAWKQTAEEFGTPAATRNGRGHHALDDEIPF